MILRHVLFSVLVCGLIASSYAQPLPLKASSSNKQDSSKDKRGTDELPLVIKVVPGQGSENATNQEERNREKQLSISGVVSHSLKEIAMDSRINVVITGFLLFVAAGQLWYFKKQLGVMQSTLTDLERPYMFVELSGDVFPQWAKTQGGKVMINFSQSTYKIRGKLINVGRAPAKLTALYHRTFFTEPGGMPNPIDPVVEASDPLPQGFVVGAGKEYEFPFDLAVGSTDMREKSLFMLGYLRYADIIGQRHLTGFCCRYERSTNRFVLIGDDRYNYAEPEKSKSRTA